MSISGKATKKILVSGRITPRATATADVKRNLGTSGADQDIKEGLPPLPKQKREEGRGCAPIDKVTARNTYTTNDGGTKRG